MKMIEGVWTGCGKTEWSEISHCICEHKRVKYDGCGHMFLKKDMSMNCMYPSLCKCCNDPSPYLMDNMAIGYFERKTNGAHTAMSVEVFGDKLQLIIRSFHLGVSALFPAMKKKELVTQWLNNTPVWMDSDIRLLFDAAILRLIPEYITREEVALLRARWIQKRKKANEATPFPTNKNQITD